MLTRFLIVVLLTLSFNVNAEVIQVKYRETPINTDGTSLIEYSVLSSNSSVRRVLHDENYDYLVVELQVSRNQTKVYHYCGVSKSHAQSMAANSRPGLYYVYEIKGQYDCRSGIVPSY